MTQDPYGRPGQPAPQRWGTPQWGPPQSGAPQSDTPQQDPYGPPLAGSGLPYGTRPFPPGYGGGHPGYGRPARNGLGVAALVCGIAAILLSWTVAGGVILGILATVFGFVTRGRVRRGEADNGGVALAGIVTGILGLVLGLGFIAVYVAVSPSIRGYVHCANDANGDRGQVDRCGQELRSDVGN